MPVYNGRATDFVNFTRGSLATVTDSDGKIKWAPHNLLTNSENFAVSPWVARNSVISNNVAVAPNGTTTADSINADGAGSFHYVEPVVSFTYFSVSYTLAVFMKKDTNRYGWVSSYDGTNTYGGVFDLQNGVYVGNRTGSGPSTNSITPVGNDWFLCTITYTPVAVTTSYPAAFGTNNDGNLGLIDASTGKIFLWGAHLYRSDLGGMQSNGSAYPMYNPTTPKNLLGFTEDFTNASYWTNVDTADVTTGVTNPRGLSGATLFYPTSSGTDRIIWRASIVGGTVSTPYTLSVYAKATGVNFLYLGTFGGGTGPSSVCAFFDLQNGTKTQTGSYFTSASITPLGDGWYRCSATANATVAGVYPIFGLADANNSSTVTASGTSGIYLWGAQLSDSASLDPYVANHFAAPTSAAYYGPRLDYDPVTLACKGMLVEALRTNLRVWSSAFNNADWSKPNTSVTPDDIASPDGTLTADRITSTASNSGYVQSFTYSTTVGATYTLSGYFKAGSQKYVTFYDESSGLLAAYDLEAGTVVSGGANASIVPVGNGWFRCIRVTTYNIANYKQISISGGTSGLGGNWPISTSFYAWGIQIEAGSFATSYIPTGASTVDRNADVGQVSVNAIPYSTNECTFVIDVQRFAAETGDEGSGVEFSTGAFQTNIIQMMYDYGSYNLVNARVFSSGGSLVLATRGGSSPNFVAGELPRKIGVALKSGNTVVAATGLLGATSSTTFTIPQTTRLKFSSNSDGAQGSDFMGWIRNITYLPRRVTNEELQQRTL
ncbi:MAG: hypothetical protein [Caudoviricetes sp.]|nr:MAG: hypothetical protein [Caudoviricetes sp.]